MEKRIGYQPTIQVLYGLAAYFDPEYLRLEAIPKVAPKALLDWFQSREGKWFARELNDEGMSDAAMLKRYEEGPLRRVRQGDAYLASKDANFVFATDTPSSPTYGNLPGLNGYLEMKQLQKAGMSLDQILKSATINNAHEFKVDLLLGASSRGKLLISC